MIQEKKEYSNNNLLQCSNNKNLISPFIKEFPKYEPKIKIAVLASGNGSNFEYIIKSIQNRQLNAEISVLIVNNPNCLAIKKAKKYNIKYVVLNHRDCKSRIEHDNLIINKLEHYNVEIVVMAGWMRIVGENLINKFKNRLINIHPSLLPSFKGIDAIQQAIDSKVKITGCTVHYVQKEVDSGSVIIQAAVPLMNEENKDNLKNRIQEMEHIILPLAIAIVAKEMRTNIKDKMSF